MPVFLKPNEIVDVTLQCESSLPEADRVIWSVKVLSQDAMDDYEAALSEAGKQTNETATGKLLKAVIMRIAVAWKNLTDADGKLIELNESTLGQFSQAKLWRYATDLPSATVLGELTIKK